MTDHITLSAGVAGGLALALSGRIDAHEAPALEQILREAVDAEHNRVDADLSAVTFIDRKALIALRLGRELCRAQSGELHVVALSDSARVIFELTELGQDMLPERLSARAGQAGHRVLANLSVQAQPGSDTAVVRILGRLDALTGRGLRQELAARVADWREVTADLTAVTGIDSPGMASLVWLVSELRMRHGQLRLRVAASSEVERMLELAGFARFMTVDPVSAPLAA